MTDGLKAMTGRRIARFLQKETGQYSRFSAMPPRRLRMTLRPGDVLLVEGSSRIATAIKYLTTSTWSHAAFYVGAPDVELIEADVIDGVRSAPLCAYDGFNTRICRPVGLSAEDLETVIADLRGRVGNSYDLRNIADLVRYLLPQPPVPKRWRRRMLALGSGDPTRAICSTLIAQAFQKVRYPILPEVQATPDMPDAEEILHIRHHSLFTPRDFDLSPYFRIVKPTIEGNFDYKSLSWYEDAEAAGDRQAVTAAAPSST